METNVTKCTLADMEMEISGSSRFLIYLVQGEYRIDMGICPFYKMWHNREGEQQRCWFNMGPVQVNCYGRVPVCENPEEYAQYRGTSFKKIVDELEHERKTRK